LIGLVAGKLTEAYDRPSIVLCSQHEGKSEETKKREYESEMQNSKFKIQNHSISNLES